MDLQAEKNLARAEALTRRAVCDPAWGAAMAGHILRDGPPPAGAVVAAFISLPGEISTAPLLAALAARNYKIGLPYTPARGQKLEFRAWAPGELLHPGRFSTVHPEGPPVTPDFIFIPLLAFDAAGNRLGYGGGYYDRTLAALPNAYRMGCAFAAQEAVSVPAGPADIKLHAVATEKELRMFP